MPHLAPSPTISETEFDIATALFDDEDDNGSKTGTRGSRKSRESAVLNAREIFDFDEDGGESGEDDDATFIALQQAASNRKASNVKGRSVKKGGGFQAMGTFFFFLVVHLVRKMLMI
jgi:ATP-dependent RNA helicase DDX54/DBP10